jgi:hypothetical protein
LSAFKWIRRGGALPESANLLTALTQTTYTFQGKLLLEPKADQKARIGFSLDELSVSRIGRGSRFSLRLRLQSVC